jgi:hypothetical protein
LIPFSSNLAILGLNYILVTSGLPSYLFSVKI